MSERDDDARLRAFRRVLLWGLQPIWLDGLLTAATAAFVLWSRFALLASGPWEWDETLFARGIMHFELAAHFPHPPGFPGWLALGHLLWPFAGTPLRALQLASAGLSVAALWPLVALGRRVAPPAVASAAALLVLVAPGPWLHAVRGFSETPAAAFILLAALAAVTGRVTTFTLLTAAAFLVRPILLPPLAVLWLGVAAGVRPCRRLLPGVAVAMAAVVVAVVAMAVAEGGWGRLVAAFATHAGRHFARLVNNPGGWSDLGLAKGLGGGVLAAGLLAAAAVGVAAWAAKQGPRSAALWLAVLAVAVVQLLFLQNRTYSRYAVPVELALAPLLAGAAAPLPRQLGVGFLVVLAALLGVRSYPLVREQHDTELASWAAVETANREARARGMAVVVEPELYPFASYLWHLQGGGRMPASPAVILSPWAPEPWPGVGRPYLVATCHRHLYLGPLVSGSAAFGPVSARLRPLTQGRMLEAVVLCNPPLPLQGFWPAEETPSEERFMWAGAEAELELPPLPAGTALGLELRPAPGPAPLRVLVNGRLAGVLDGRSPRAWLWAGPELLRSAGSQRVRLERAQGYPAGGGDSRQLAVQLLAVRAVGPRLPWGGPTASAAEREALDLLGVGFHGPEDFGRHGRGCWLEPRARLVLRAGEGSLGLRLWAPRPTPANLVIRVSGRVAAGPLAVSAEPGEVLVTILPGDVGDGRVAVELQTAPFVPAAAGTNADTRALGVVLGEVRYEPGALEPLARALVGGRLDGDRGGP